MPRLYWNGTMHDTTCNVAHYCIPRFGPGATLYDGNITIMSVSGRYWSEDFIGRISFDYVTFVTYLDFQEKQIKFASNKIPKEEIRYTHCTTAVTQSTVFVYGGLRDNNSNKPQEIVYDGFFLHFPNYKDPNDYEYSKAVFRNEYPCGVEVKEYPIPRNVHIPTQTCAFRVRNSIRELVVPTYDYYNRKACTAILNLETLTWRSIPNDNRKQVYTATAHAYRYIKD